MTMTQRIQRAAVVLVLTVAGGATVASAQTRLNGAGATFPAPIYKQWIKDYTASHPDVQIDYQAKGSGAGIAGITDKTVDFAGSDAPMSKDELAKAGGNIVEFPSVAGGVAIAYNLPGFNGDLKLSGPVVADIFLGNITSWNDAKIAALNPGANLPNLAITPIVRGDKSGTTFVFTSYLATQSQDAKDVIGVDKTGNWPKAQRGEKSDGVTQLLKAVKGGIGYIEQNYASQNKLPVALLQNKAGKFLAPTAETVSAAASSAAANMSGDQLTANLWNADGENAYPIASFTYLIVYKDLGYVKDAAKAKAMVDFLTWATTQGQAKAAGLDYAPVGDAVTAKVQAAIGSLTWSGAPVRTANAN
jgi:phosphate transport system substrate-binding protein